MDLNHPVDDPDLTRHRRNQPGSLLKFNRTSSALMSGFILLIGLIIYVWWPLVVDYFATADPNIPLWQ